MIHGMDGTSEFQLGMIDEGHGRSRQISEG
jgi:hypothetical protein